MALWQLLNLGTGCTVPYIYIYIYLYIPRIFIIAKLWIRKPLSLSVLIISDTMQSEFHVRFAGEIRRGVLSSLRIGVTSLTVLYLAQY